MTDQSVDLVGCSASNFVGAARRIGERGRSPEEATLVVGKNGHPPVDTSLFSPSPAMRDIVAVIRSRAGGRDEE
jgi:hypothetical protein